MKQSIFGAADILLPKNRDEKHMQAWSAIACDQYTSDGSYWEKVKETVGDMPSTCPSSISVSPKKRLMLR